MKPWIIDAKDIEMETDVRDFQSNLLHTTAASERYLASDNTSELLVVGPKGTGKTLLLKAKRIRTASQGISCLPENALVDKPIGAPPIFSQRDITSIMEKAEYWVQVWIATIIIAVMKSRKMTLEKGLESEKLQEIYSSELYHSACDIFGLLISISRKEYFNLLLDLKNVLVPSFRNIHSATYLFIDNIDEYFESHLGMDGKNNPLAGVLEKSFWYHSQLGLANAARQIHGVNSHVKVCASIRKEVAQLMIDEALGLQQLGGTCDISYGRADLEDILRRNILAEGEENVFNVQYIYERFVGSNSTNLIHMATAESEPFEDYMIRHSLWRPRDLAVIGRGISAITKDRRSPTNVRESVNRSTLIIARSYFAECKPHLKDFDENLLLPLISSNVLTFDDLKEISVEYDKQYAHNYGANGEKSCHVFCQLYKIGLLGYLNSSTNPEDYEQCFLLPGEGPPNTEGIIPDSPMYLIHPVLDSLIASLNSAYLRQMNTLNIIGRGRKWRNENDFRFVLKGDVVKFSEIMNDPDLSAWFPEAFQAMVTEAAKALAYSKVEGGDSVFLIDRNPVNVIRAAREICANLQRSPCNKKLRFGGSHGLVIVDNGGSGRAMRSAARIEPFAKSGTILVDHNFYESMAEFDIATKFVEANEVTHEHIPRVDGKFDVGKNETDLQTLVKLFEFDCGKSFEDETQ